MLAAVPSETDRRLELFRLALLLISRQNTQLPPPLAEYFESLLAQARLLVHDPSRISHGQLPQAMQLANEFRSNEKFSHALADVNRIQDVSPQVAQKALSTLEPVLAPAD